MNDPGIKETFSFSMYWLVTVWVLHQYKVAYQKGKSCLKANTKVLQSMDADFEGEKKQNSNLVW